jgi:hypothetical protein
LRLLAFLCHAATFAARLFPTRLFRRGFFRARLRRRAALPGAASFARGFVAARLSPARLLSREASSPRGSSRRGFLAARPLLARLFPARLPSRALLPRDFSLRAPAIRPLDRTCPQPPAIVDESGSGPLESPELSATADRLSGARPPGMGGARQAGSGARNFTTRPDAPRRYLAAAPSSATR